MLDKKRYQAFEDALIDFFIESEIDPLTASIYLDLFFVKIKLASAKREEGDLEQ